jgi:hypothetical protein
MSGIADKLAGLTPKQRALLELRLQRKQAAAAGAAIARRAPGGGPLPLSFAQQRLWFIDQLQPGSVFFNVSTALRLSGALDAAAFGRALTEVVRRHEVLRTTFRTVDGQPFQVIGAAENFPLRFIDLSGLPTEERNGRLRELMAEEARVPFDLAAGPLLRAALLQLAAAEHVVLFTIHHIICDGLSMAILIREVATLYESFAAGRPSPLAELPVQYADYAVWQRARLQGAELERQLAYWRRQLAGAPPLLTLRGARPRPARQTFRGAALTQILPPALSAAVRELAQREGTTPFVLLLAAFKALLCRHTGREDLIVGSPLANRTHVELEGLIGFFTNPLALRTQLAGDPSFKELLRRVHEVCLEAHAHQVIPFQKLVDELRLKRDLSHHPLFQIAFTYDSPRTQTVESETLRLTPLALPAQTVQHDLTLHMTDTGAGLIGHWQYSTELYDAALIEQMAEEFAQLLARVERQPDARLSELTDFLMERERARSGARAQEAAAASLQKLKQIRRKAVGVQGRGDEVATGGAER